jgi:hypothetical protein
MTSTSGTPDATHANTKTAEPSKHVSALLIPASETQPPRRIDITGLADLQAAVGGYIEMLSYHGDPDVCAYVNEEGKYTDGCARNPRATRLLGPILRPGDWIAGDVVIIGFDREAGEDRDLPDGFESRLGIVRMRDVEDILAPGRGYDQGRTS